MAASAPHAPEPAPAAAASRAGDEAPAAPRAGDEDAGR